MASFRKRGETWRAEVMRRGVRRSDTFTSKGAAVAWASRVEAEVMAGVRGEVPNLTVSALIDRYEEEVSAEKKGKRWEGIRLDALRLDRIALVRLRVLDSPDVADWQRRRLAVVSAASVRRERNLVNHIFQIAIKEWRWLRRNPFDGVRRPKDGRPRTRIATQLELTRVAKIASPNMARVIAFAVETGMRAGEIAGLKAEDVRGRVAVLRDSKNGTSRDVPLSTKAVEAWGDGFGVSAGSISALWARYCKELDPPIVGLTFHDLRATAISRLASKLNVLELAKMVGHKNPKMLMVYYRESADEIAKKLD
jgi:integrase